MDKTEYKREYNELGYLINNKTKSGKIYNEIY